MKSIKLLSGLMLLAGISISGTALADRGHGHGHGHGGHVHGSFGLYFGFPYPYDPYPYYNPYRYPYYPPVITVPVPTQPPVYIEQGEAPPTLQQAPAAENYYWYHCDRPEGYYPYIKECPGGWQKVAPTPPPQQ
jgi:hypothetical protein